MRVFIGSYYSILKLFLFRDMEITIITYLYALQKYLNLVYECRYIEKYAD